jgi:hypothetical protein
MACGHAPQRLAEFLHFAWVGFASRPQPGRRSPPFGASFNWPLPHSLETCSLTGGLIRMLPESALLMSVNSGATDIHLPQVSLHILSLTAEFQLLLWVCLLRGYQKEVSFGARPQPGTTRVLRRTKSRRTSIGCQAFAALHLRSATLAYFRWFMRR